MIAAAVVLAISVGMLVVLPGQPAEAWKPPTHLFAAEQVLDDLLHDDIVVIPDASGDPDKAVSVQANPTIAAALRKFPGAFRAGVVGPDGYPDAIFGQSVIHPETDGTISDDWLAYLWESAWNSSLAACTFIPINPDPEVPAACQRALDERLKRIAFAVGYLNHALGDVWSHTWVNQPALADGSFPSLVGEAGGDFKHGHIAVKHVIVEGYVDTFRPGYNQDSYLLDAPTEFISNALLSSSFARTNGSHPVLGHLLEILDEVEASLDDMPDWRFISKAYLEAWRDDLYEGFQEWVTLQQVIAQELFTGKKPNRDAVHLAAREWVLAHYLSMLGLPDFVGDGLLWLAELTDLIPGIEDMLCAPPPGEPSQACSWYRQAKKDWNEAVRRIADDLLAAYFTALLGLDSLDDQTFAALDLNGDGSISVLESFNIFENPGQYLDDPRLFDPSVRPMLHAEMGGGASGPYQVEAFAPLYNTVVSAKLSVLDQHGLNSYFRQKASQAGMTVGGLDDLYAPYQPQHGASGAPNNFALGWIRSMDGDHQWRTHSLFEHDHEGHDDDEFGTGNMWLYEDCVSRLKVFPATFRQPVTGHDAFASDGDPPTNRTDPVAPVVSVTIDGVSALVDGVTYLGPGAGLAVSGDDAAFPRSEVRLEYRTTHSSAAPSPYGAGVGNPATVSFEGPDGTWTVEARALDGCGNVSPVNASSYELDTTPPEITLTNPTATMFATDEFDSIDFTATDAGSGVASLTATFGGEPVESGHVLDMFFLEPGEHTIVVTAHDRVGNEAEHTHTFTVRATAASLRNNVERAWELGLITDRAVYEGLVDKLDAAVAAHGRGAHRAEIRQLGAFIEQLRAQSGKGIDVETARRFTAFASDLIENHP